MKIWVDRLLNKNEDMVYCIEVTTEELETMLAGLREREDVMFNEAQNYKNLGNKDAQYSCLDEWHKAKSLRERIQKEIE